MDFSHEGDYMGTGSNNALMGLLAGSALNKDRDDGRSMTWFAMVIVLIVFFIAIIFLALAFKDRSHEKVSSNGNYSELLATMIAAKGMDNNNNYKGNELDRLELMQKMEASEDRSMQKMEAMESRARETQTQQEIGSLGKELAAMGFGLASKIDNVEKEQLKAYATMQNQLGAQSQVLQQLLTTQNNSAIINGVIQQLAMGTPCFPKC